MRLALLIWCALGLGLIGLKAHLDRAVLKYPDIAVRSGHEAYFIPRAMIVERDGWRGDLRRFAGCYDAREAGVIQASAIVAGCDAPQMLALSVPARALGFEAEGVLRGKPLVAVFWSSYVPPAEHLPQLAQAWAGRGEWVGRRAVPRADWSVVRLESAATPWVPLIAREPVAGETIGSLYAGRCYKPEPLSDIGSTCTVVVRLGHAAAVEFSLGPDEVADLAAVRGGLAAAIAGWKR